MPASRVRGDSSYAGIEVERVNVKLMIETLTIGRFLFLPLSFFFGCPSGFSPFLFDVFIFSTSSEASFVK